MLFCFLQHIYRGFKPGGRAAVVLPNNVLFFTKGVASLSRELRRPHCVQPRGLLLEGNSDEVWQTLDL